MSAKSDALKATTHVEVEDTPKVLTALIPLLELDGFSAEIKDRVLVVRHKK